MAVYRAESELAALVDPYLGFHHRNEARSFLHKLFHLPADLRPDYEAGTLDVRLHGMANPRSNRAVAELCHFLNGQQPYQTCLPGSRLRFVFGPPPIAELTS